MNPDRNVRAVLSQAGYEPPEFASVPLYDLDSLLIEELLAIADDAAGHRVELDAFGGLEGALSELVSFIDERSADG